MDKDEALKMAIEAVEECLDDLQGWAAYASDYFQDKWDLDGEVKAYKDKIQACKEALAQPQPKLFLDLSNSNGNHPVQPAQEPVAWIFEDELPDNYPYDEMFRYSAVIDGVRMFPVFYPAPSWQGLSDDEIESKYKTFSSKQIFTAQLRTQEGWDLIWFASGWREAEKAHGIGK